MWRIICFVYKISWWCKLVHAVPVKQVNRETNAMSNYAKLACVLNWKTYGGTFNHRKYCSAFEFRSWWCLVEWVFEISSKRTYLPTRYLYCFQALFFFHDIYLLFLFYGRQICFSVYIGGKTEQKYNEYCISGPFVDIIR